MSLEVQCGQCAKRFAAAERLAGKQVRCPGCGGVIAVPAAGSPAPATGGFSDGVIAATLSDPAVSRSVPPAATADRWEVGCPQCAKRFAAASSLAGKNVRCPGCGGVLKIPASPPASSTAATPPARHAPQTAGNSGATAGPFTNDPSSNPFAEANPYAKLHSNPFANGPTSAAAGPADAGFAPHAAHAPGASPFQQTAGQPAWTVPPRPAERESEGIGGFLATHKMMLAAAAAPVLIVPILLLRGHTLAAVMLGLAGGAVAACGFLPQKSAAERAAANERRKAKAAGNKATGFLAGGGSAAFFTLLIVLKVVSRAARRSSDADGGGWLGMVGAVAGAILLGCGVVSIYVYLGRRFGFYPVSSAGYLALAGVMTLVLAAMPAGGSDPYDFAADFDAGTSVVSDAGSGASIAGVQPFTLSGELPSFPDHVSKRTLQPGVDMAEVRWGTPIPGLENQLYVYTPSGTHSPRSLPCVLIAPAGATPVSGMGLASGDQPEHIPYVRAGFAVVAYTIPGALPGDPDSASNRQFQRAYQQYRDAKAGLQNARDALEYVVNRMPEVDPQRLYTAGHSSAGKQALLLAAHEPRIKGCVSFAGVCNVPEAVRPYYHDLRRMIPDVDPFLERTSPHNHANRITCPVLLFHARDDSVVPYSQSTEMASLLQRQGKQATLKSVPFGDHYDPMIEQGIPEAIRWLREIDRPAQLAAAASTGNSPRQMASGGSPSRPPNPFEPPGESPFDGGVPVDDPPTGADPRFPGLGGLGGMPPEASPPEPMVPDAFPPDPFPRGNRPPGAGPSGFRPPNFRPPNMGPFGPGSAPGGPSRFGPRGPQATGSRAGGMQPGGTPANRSTAGGGNNQISLDQVLADLKSGDKSRVILATGRMRGLSQTYPDRKAEVAKALADLIAQGDTNISLSASFALPEWMTAEVVPQLEAALVSASLPIRHQLFQAIAQFQDPVVIPLLAQHLTDDKDRHVAGAALTRWGERAETDVLNYADHSDRNVRREVVNILRRIGTQKSLPVLQRMARSDPDRGIQLSAQSVVRQLETGR